MDYQTYAFNLLSSSDLRGVVFTCQDDFCPYPSTLGIDRVSGEDVLRALDMGGTSYWLYCAYLFTTACAFGLIGFRWGDSGNPRWHSVPLPGFVSCTNERCSPPLLISVASQAVLRVAIPIVYSFSVFSSITSFKLYNYTGYGVPGLTGIHNLDFPE